MTREPLCRVAAVVQAAVLPAAAAPEVALRSDVGTPWADRVRIAVGPRDWRDGDALHLLAQAITALEHDVARLRWQLELQSVGITLRSELVEVGGDGMRLQRRLSFAHDTAVLLFLLLPIRSAEHLLRLEARALHAPEGTELSFENLSREETDELVRFVFQQQGRERRRVLDAVHR